MKKILLILTLLISIILPTFASETLSTERGKVTKVEYIDFKTDSNSQTKQLVDIKILSGKFKGQKVTLENMITTNPAYDLLLSKNDRVILHFEPKNTIYEDLDDVEIYISDIERINAYYFLGIIFLILLLLVGKKKGILSFLSIILTILLILLVFIPMILNSINPVIASLITCIIATVITIYLVGGFNSKSNSAILGTSFSLLFAGILSIITIKIGTLTGFTDEESLFLYATRPDLDFTGILSASMMLAALGAVMDVGVSIASTINEIYNTNNKLSVNELFSSGMNVGKDVIGTMANTLILVYLGSSIPLLLLSNNIDMIKFFNLNHVLTEISSALIGTISIIACVPITAIISAYLIKTKK